MKLTDKHEAYQVDSQEDIEDLRGKLKDQWWRLNHLYYIMDEDGNKILFQMNWAQKMFYFAMWFLNIILKSRQQGFTTFIQIYILDVCLFNSNIRAGVIAHTRNDAEVFFRDKIKFAYDNLLPWVRAERPAIKNDAGELLLANNSSIRVGTSLRSGTLQYLHISEFGKICARDPEKAREIVTGALNTVHEGNFVFVESTAEGNAGYFYTMTQAARNLLLAKKKLGAMDYKFHFFPWWKKPRNRTDPDGEEIPGEYVEYFEKLAHEHGIKLDKAQKVWYVKTAEVQQEDMKREHPSTPDEAFEQAIAGAYYARQMAWLRKNNRLTKIPFDPKLAVNVFWDLGRNDSTSLWLHQRAGTANLFPMYYENHGEAIQHYGSWLQKLAQENNLFFGEMYLPHDAEVVDYTRADNKTRAQVLGDMGFKYVVVPKVNEKGEAHQAVRDVLPTCWFDEAGCDKGIKCLDNYQKEWDPKLATFKSTPLHNWASHGNDAFEQFARGYAPPKDARPGAKPKRKNWRTR